MSVNRHTISKTRQNALLLNSCGVKRPAQGVCGQVADEMLHSGGVEHLAAAISGQVQREVALTADMPVGYDPLAPALEKKRPYEAVLPAADGKLPPFDQLVGGDGLRGLRSLRSLRG